MCIRDSHYTAPVIIESIYHAVEQMGLEPKTMLEPATVSYTHLDLRGLTNFNNVGTLACLGTATAEANRTILMEIGEAVKNIHESIYLPSTE